jgi:hypothetical protein
VPPVWFAVPDNEAKKAPCPVLTPAGSMRQDL